MRFYTPAGSPERVIRSGAIVDGVLTVKDTGKENFQAYIDSFADQCDIANLVARAVREPQLLNQGNPSFGDFTKAPKTLADALNMLNDAQNFYEGLPGDVKAQFGNSFYNFATQVNNDDIMEKLGFKKVDPKEIPVETVSEVKE